MGHCTQIAKVYVTNRSWLEQIGLREKIIDQIHVNSGVQTLTLP